MLTLLDRYLTRSFLKAFIVCLFSLLSLFIIVDLFLNLDEFSANTSGLGQTLNRIGKFYSYKVAEIFDRLCQPVILLAAMFSVAWMQRNNEILPLLAAGISSRRIVRPVLVSSVLMLGVGIVNQEMILPRVDSFMVEYRNEGNKEVKVSAACDGNNIRLVGSGAIRDESLVKDFVMVMPPAIGRDTLTTLQAREARYLPRRHDDRRSGGWLLTGTAMTELPPGWTRTDILDMIVPGKFFLYTDIDFDTMTRTKNWFTFVDTWTLLDELNRGTTNTARQANIATIFHMRLTRPLLGGILVLMGLGIVLQNHQRNLYISAGLCLILCMLFFLVGFVCRWLGDSEMLSASLAAWIPVLIFGPLSFVLFDAVHT